MTRDIRARLQDAVALKTEPRELENLCAEVLALVEKFEHLGPFDDETLRDLRRMIPFGIYDADGTATQNPLTKVYFRAGLLAFRERAAVIVEEHHQNPGIASKIREIWWDEFGQDPGAPRLFAFEELVRESVDTDGRPVFEALEIAPSVEALPIAFQFLNAAVVGADPTEPKQD